MVDKLKSKLKVLTEDTPVVMSIGLLAMLTGAISWLTFVSFTTAATANSVEELKKKQSVVETMRIDIAVIKEDVAQIRKAVDDGK